MQGAGKTALIGSLALVAQALLTACAASSAPAPAPGPAPVAAGRALGGDDVRAKPAGPGDVVTLAFAGDMHFELHLAALLDRPRGALGPISRTLAAADLSMVNLETSITGRGTRVHQDYAFRTSPKALDVLAAAGVDVVTMANNHGVDYGPVGLRDTLGAVRTSPVPVIGIGRNRAAAFTPLHVSVRGTDFAFFAASSEPDQLARSAAGPSKAGIAAAFEARPSLLLDAVRAASARDEVVVVYLHWGTELQACPTRKQLITARALADAGADVVVGSHAHVLLGSGWLGATYVSYGLGNFLWYHDKQPESGVLRLSIRDGAVIEDSWVPARIQTDGRPLPLSGRARAAAVAAWRSLRGCADLSAAPADRSASTPAYRSSVQPIGPRLRARMRFSHAAGCPLGWADLRYLRMTFLGFDGRPHTGEMVVREDYADAVTRVFKRLYDARWPIGRMRLVDDYGGDDERSMAANNTSGFNCRRVAGRAAWSAHAYGTAIDVNPVQNPYLTPGSVHPPAGAPFAQVDRSAGARVPTGVVREGDVVVRAFAGIGWEWGGEWSTSPDYQHFSAAGS